MKGGRPLSSEQRANRRVSSTARSISHGLLARKICWFLLLDILLAIALSWAFVFSCYLQLPEGTDGVTPRVLWQEGDFWQSSLVLATTDGAEHAFAFSSAARMLGPAAGVVLACEVFSLCSSALETRRIRRKLRPLNELALAAEAMGSAAAGDMSLAKIESLEHAIQHASVESPQVSTGDQDLRSIEVALNGLLRQMQEAKLQQMRFVNDASHELRTPIAVIQGYVNMLDRWGNTDPSVLDESIEALKGESEHMQRLVEQLLFLARGDSGRNTLKRTTFDLGELAREVCEESRMIDPDHEYELVLPQADEGEGSPAPLTLVGDETMIKQSMRVIVQNAARYSPAGSCVTIGAGTDEADGAGSAASVWYSVQDEGVGMSEHDLAHIFERFYRADAARRDHANGTGLGLSIAKWIVDAHDGKIEVLSREGAGTRFTVHLPA